MEIMTESLKSLFLRKLRKWLGKIDLPRMPGEIKTRLNSFLISVVQDSK